MGNQYEVRQLEPFVVRWGAAIPIRQGQWNALQEKTAFLLQPGQSPEDPEIWLHGYYAGLVRSHAVINFPNLDQADAQIERAGEFLCIQSGGKMWCPEFPPPSVPRSRFGEVIQMITQNTFSPPRENYSAFIALLTHLAPHLENALLFVADEESFLDRLAIKDGQLKRTAVSSGGWSPLSGYPESQLPDERETEKGSTFPSGSPPRIEPPS